LDQNCDTDIKQPADKPFHLTVHKQPSPSKGYIIEVRPKTGSWTPFVAAVPLTDKLRVNLHILPGAPGNLPSGGVLHGAGEGFTDDWAFCFAKNEATPEMSYYLYCTELPSKLLFGANKGEQFTVDWPKTP
jgi:hypothetical protein